MRTALGWTIATAVGFALAGLIPCEESPEVFYLGVQREVIYFGALGALPQALFLFLRGRLGSALAWPFVTGLAVPLAYYFALFTVLVGGQAFRGLGDFWLIAGCVVAGTTVGLAQSVVALGLAFRPRAALRWVVASALGGPAAGAFLLTITGLLLIGSGGRVSFQFARAVPMIPPAFDLGCDPVGRPLLGLLLGALYGAITGVVLERCLRETASA